MGINIRQWLAGKLWQGSGITVDCAEVWKLAEEIRIRELAFNVCVNMVANAVSKCEFKTIRKGEPVRGDEYYLWNIEPNRNQNSSAFIHKLIYYLYRDNEALVISVPIGNGREHLLIADSYSVPFNDPFVDRQYQEVTLGDVTMQRTFWEPEVLHFTLNAQNVKPVLDGLYESYGKLIDATMKNFKWSNGKHMKVHISSMQQGNQDDVETLTELINKQVKPFLTGDNGVLPEYDGYEYSNIGGNPDSNRTTRDIRALVDDIFEFTARAFSIPPVLLLGDVAGDTAALNKWLTTCIDPLCDQLEEEITRKRYGLNSWKENSYLEIDTSASIHFDLFANAANIEKLTGSGAFRINEVRAAAGQSLINEPWANDIWITKNFARMAEEMTAEK